MCSACTCIHIPRSVSQLRVRISITHKKNTTWIFLVLLSNSPKHDTNIPCSRSQPRVTISSTPKKMRSVKALCEQNMTRIFLVIEVNYASQFWLHTRKTPHEYSSFYNPTAPVTIEYTEKDAWRVTKFSPLLLSPSDAARPIFCLKPFCEQTWHEYSLQFRLHSRKALHEYFLFYKLTNRKLQKRDRKHL